MSEQFTITGVVFPANGVDRVGMKVQAFDRDMPSVERRTGAAPELLGDATTDAQGGFKIAYTLDQFKTGDGTSLFQRAGEKNADVSFRIFNKTGQELSITSIQGNRDVGPDQIIFNAPDQLVVNISVVAVQPAAATSEYERLLNMVTPIISDVPLAQLTEEDVRFILSELDAGQEGAIPQRIEWLRRCALLVQNTDLPIESLYGWGRKDLPAPFAELSAVPLKDLPPVLEKLSGLREERLRELLLAAIAEEIIPTSFRDRVDQIVRLLVRRNKVARQVIAQLLDSETNTALAGFTVTTFDQEDAPGENSGVDITDDEGRFSLAFYLPKEMPANGSPREFRLEIVSPDGEKITDAGLLSIDLSKPETEIFRALIQIPKAELNRQKDELQNVLIDVPPELQTFLNDTHNIQTLSDIRRKGGLSKLADLPAAIDVAHISKLESLADLDRISPDIGVSKTLLDRNFESVLAVADTPHTEFVGKLSSGEQALSPQDAAMLHLTATAQTQLLNNMVMKVAADHANGFQLANGLGDEVEQKCGCSDCEAAVSPTAYLSALLDYMLKHVRNNKKKVDLQFLVDTFHQPFIDLPTDCEAVENQLHQVRICIEVLREFIGPRPLADPGKEAALAKAEAEYAFAAYAMLLNRIGSSYEEIRSIRAENAENRRALAERVGIDLTGSRPTDEMDQLFLDPSDNASPDSRLTEASLERIFGLADTMRDPLSEGAKSGDDQNQITRWNLNGVSWGQTTDQQGMVYLTLVNPEPAVFRVEVHKDRARTTLLAKGEIATANGAVKLVSEVNGHLSGVIEIAHTADTNAISIAAVPSFQSAQLKHLRTLWFQQDHPADLYSEDASPRFPIIDPDLIGPDDFRNPSPKKNAGDANQAFDLWLARREFVDAKLAKLKSDRETKGIADILKQVVGNPLPDLDGLLLVLTKGGAGDEIKAARDGIAALDLAVDGFMRLMSIRAKDQLAQSDNRNEKVTESEWHEFYSILTQALKAREFDSWRTAEESADIKLGLQQFWFSVTEPKEGDWPPDISPNQPLIDPDIIKLVDLPDWLARKEAITLWQARKVVLEKIPGDLNAERQAKAKDKDKGFEAVLRLALGHPTSGDPLQHDLNELNSSLDSLDEKVRSNATNQIVLDLHLTVISFNRLMEIKAASDQSDPAKEPTAAEWSELFAILTPASKVKHLYSEWVKEEAAAGLVYWEALKAKLPLWRASAESRQTWQRALRTRSQPPIIQPTVMGADDLQHVIAGDTAFDIWKERNERVGVLHDQLKAKLEAEAPDSLAGLDQIINDALGFDFAALEALEQERLAGKSVEKRLEQLGIVASAFNYLIRIRALAKANQPITESEFETLYQTLTLVILQREFAAFRSQERDNFITLAPDLFKLVPTAFPDLSTPRWLSTWQERLDWQDTLQSRFDQETAIVTSLENAVSAVEEARLPALRDALIDNSDAVGAELKERAEWITARLLIDARSGGCRTTTRVAQALETLQTLIFDLRTGQFIQQAGSSLSLVSDYFDEEWKWIGSYATWRSAMFVFIYPENILRPSLLKEKTPAFAKLIQDTRTLRINPATACEKAEAYAEYFRDICSLEIEATCQASTVMYTGEGCDRQPSNPRSMFYMFARSESGKAYWSAYDAGSASANGPIFWKEADGFHGTKISQIIAATPYRRTVANDKNTSITGAHGVVESSYIYLFCIAGEADKRNLKLARLSLDEFGSWVGNGTPIDLSMPPLNFSTLAILPVQTQNEFSPPALIFQQFRNSHFYYRSLNDDGTEWEQKGVDWPSFYFIYDGPGQTERIKAVLRVNGELLWVINTTISSNIGLEMQLVQLKSGNNNPTVWKSLPFGKAEFLGALPGPEDISGMPGVGEVKTSSIYFFWRDSAGSHYMRFSNLKGDEANNLLQATLTDLIRIAPNSGGGATGQQMLAYQREKNGHAFYLYRFADTANKLVGSATVRALPRVKAPLNVPLHQTGTALQQRRQEIVDAFTLNADATGPVLQYLREAYYFVPLHLALALQSAGHYLAALDCFRTIYDYESLVGPPNQRNIYYGLELDAKLAEMPEYQQADGWLLDPLNPHSIADTRHLTYTRFTITSLIRCLLDFADSEFTQETGESLTLARTLYLTALALLNLPELQQKLGVCDDLVAELKIAPGKDIPAEVPAAVAGIMEDLTKAAPSIRHFGKAARDAKAKLQGDAEWSVKVTEARAVVRDAIASAPLPAATGSMVVSKSALLKEQHVQLLTQPAIDNVLQAVSKKVVNNVFVGLGVNAPVVQPDIGKALPAAPPPLVLPIITPSLEFCIPPNPILKALRLHAELNLFKLRTCRNIAGLKRQLDPYAAPTDTTTGMPAIGAGGQLVLPGIATLHPSLYRYPVLIERAKQLVQLAAQIEGNMLSAIEKRDSEAQTLLQARQQLGLAQAGLRLQDLRITEANDGVTLSDLQQERAQIQIDTYKEWLQTGPNEYETQMMDAYATAAAAQKGATEASRMIQMKQSAISSAQLAAQIAQTGNPYAVVGGMVAGVANLSIDDYLFRDLSEDTKKATEYAAVAQIASVNAALERRKDEWQLQQRLAEQDSLIGDQQKKIATDHVQIATQERAIAGIQADNAKDSVEFLTNKFTNVELFDWMSGILEGVYKFFLQQATAMAKLAENQLAFERQEVPPACINSDYWALPSEDSVIGQADGHPQDRRGLTGSARLLQDIYQLDQYAFNSNKRKLLLTKTVSLSKLVPVEFERFRETGILPFVTPMELFDRGFPGHYLRLLKRVRTSVIALIPPVEGLHATLSTTGPSRVVIGGDVFQTVPIRRAPEFIAMSAPNNSTGVFELDAQPDMLLPFEGSGVAMSWEFKMPKAANRFDYRTIADVLVTLEYTALDSVDYRQQVIQTLKPTLNSDRPFSLRIQFADQWYDLHNPEQTSTPMTVRFSTLREDFPPNVEALKIQHVVLFFVSTDTSIEVQVSHLRYSANDEPGTVGGSATSIDGIISTRSGKAGSWTTMIGKSPIGEWELALPNTEEMRKRFGDEDGNNNIQDILLVITYSARTPDWPT